MITGCPSCERKTRQIDASVYAGDYQTSPGADLYAPGRQCVECGAVFEVMTVGKVKRPELHGYANLPPRNRWEEPIA